ncbi:MAG: S9 family peptidase [Proteobacteria bacterium]|nr:S9 family peptidase [Pseudomonadota bacterium]
MIDRVKFSAAALAALSLTVIRASGAQAPPAPAPVPVPAPVSLPVPAAAAAPAGPKVVQPRRQEGGLVYDGIPPADAQLAQRLAAYGHAVPMTFLDWRADGSLLVRAPLDGTQQLQSLAAPLAAAIPLTRYPDPVGEARAARRGDGFVFLMDEGGNENAQLYYSPGAAAATAVPVRQITQGNFIHGSPVWAHDGKRVAFFGTERNSVDYDIYLADVTTAAAPQLLVGGRPGTWLPLDWSPDDSRLLVQKFVSVSDSTLYLADAASGELTPLDADSHGAGVYAARFAPDGRGVYVVTDEDGEFPRLKWKDPQTHQERRLCTDSAWGVEAFDVSADGRYVACVYNEDGRSRLGVLDTQQGRELAPAGVPQGRIGTVRFDPTGRRLAFEVQSPVSPCALYVWDAGQPAVTRWSAGDSGGLTPAQLVMPELVRYPTWDRSGAHARELSAWVYRPRTSGPAPVLVYLHGGPESQFRPQWDPFLQFVVNELGYAIVAPNVRGSRGYGRSFLALDDGVLREDAVRDVGALLVWIDAQAAFDHNRVAVMGRSYGGYLALATLVNYGERLRGGIDVAGISDFVSFLRDTSPYRRDARRAEYGDERDLSMRVFLDRISPLSSAARIGKPLLVIAGADDARVPLSQSAQLVWGVRSAGGEVWYLVAQHAGHHFGRDAQREAAMLTQASFLRRLAAHAAVP